MRVIKLFSSAMALWLGLTLALGQAWAACPGDTYPDANKEVRVIVPKMAGGGTDLAARGLAKMMSEDLNAKFTVVNKPDANGVSGMNKLAKAKPDGYTIGMVTVELAIFPHQGKTKLTVDDFEPIIAPIAAPAALIVHKAAPFNTLDEFVEHLKAHPGTIQMGNSGVGAIWHVATLAFEKEFGVRVKHVPYPQGTAAIAQAIMAKQINATLADPSAFREQIESGELKVLAVMSARRTKMLPDVPTFIELGHNLTVRAWATLVAPKGTPQDILNILRGSARRISATSEYDDYFLNCCIDPTNFVAEDAEEMMKSDNKMYGPILKGLLKR